jgi:hypothetical protein
MHISLLAFTLLTGCAGIYLGFRTVKNFRYMTIVEASLLKQISNSIMAGGAGALIFFTIIMIVGLFDENYVWTTRKFLGAIFVSLIPSGMIIVGSFIQSIMLTGYKRILFKELKRKDRNK